jgi:hypothetical protein
LDRHIVWPGAIPLETDQLHINRDVMVALGMLIQELFGTGTIVAGLAATPGTGLNVAIAAGRIYSLENVDNTAYSSLPADTTDQVMKQGILLEGTTLAVAAPTTSGDSINYLIEAAYQDNDSGPTLLNFFNSMVPTQPYIGPNNTGQTVYTVRQGLVSLQAKAGAQATSGSQTTPTPDSGYTGLWVVTVAFGASSLTSANIAPYAGAPIIPAGGIFSQSLNAPSASPLVGVFADTAAIVHNGTLASFTYDLPQIAVLPAGWRSPLFSTVQAGVITIAPNATDKIGTKSTGSSLASSSAAGNNVRLRAGPSQTWLIESQVGTWS